MLRKYRRRRQLERVRPGDGSPVPEYRLGPVARASASVAAVDRATALRSHGLLRSGA